MGTGESIRRLYIEGSGGNLGPHSFHPTARIIGANPTAPPLLELRRGPLVPRSPDPCPRSLVPWSPVIPVEVDPSAAGDDIRQT